MDVFQFFVVHRTVITMAQLTFLLLVFFVMAIAKGIPKPDETKIFHSPLEKDSAHMSHYDGDRHNVRFDHEAFLGEEAKEFSQVTPEESRRRLGIIVDRIDGNKDGLVTLSELKSWIEYTQRQYINNDCKRWWQQYSPNNDTISWEEYRRQVYGFVDELSREDMELETNGISYEGMLKRDRRRWGVADSDLDDILTQEEISAFLHPEDNPLMRDVVLSETIEDMDKDKDGNITMAEYIGDMYKPTDPDDEEPEWVANERQIFTEHRDINGDGFLDREEMRSYIVPKEFDHAESEAKHLIFEADADSDDILTKDEILNKYDVFVGSQVTDFGEALSRHDEF